MSNGYDYDRATLTELFIRLQFPERTQRESAILRDFFQMHVTEYDSYSFSVRVGQGLTPDPSHLDGVQRNTVFSTKKRIDVLAWKGAQPYIFELKERVSPAALGQLVTYRHLWMEEHPDAGVPILGVIGRTVDPDTERVLVAAGVTIYLYPPTAGNGGNAPGGVPADNAPPA
jgi:hypothetical protein